MRYGTGCSAEGCEGRHYSRGYCSMHYRRLYRHGHVAETRTNEVARLLGEIPVDREACWPWPGAGNGEGYGTLVAVGSHQYAHRLAYELFRGPIPEGLQIDHLCRNRLCFNPWHLEPVTCRENLLRGDTLAARNASRTHCVAGHPFDAENTYVYHGRRQCRACARSRSRKGAA